MFKPFFQTFSERLAPLGLRAALLCAPVICVAQTVPVEIPVPSGVPTVMTTKVMQADIEKLSKDLTAIGAYLTVDSDGRLGCACGGGTTVPNLGGRRGPRSPLDTQHLIRALEAVQLVVSHEKAGLSTTIYSTQLSQAGGLTALPN